MLLGAAPAVSAATTFPCSITPTPFAATRIARCVPDLVTAKAVMATTAAAARTVPAIQRVRRVRRGAGAAASPAFLGGLGESNGS